MGGYRKSFGCSFWIFTPNSSKWSESSVAQGLRCFVFMREDYKVEPFADVRAKAGLSSTFLKTPSVGQAGNRTKAFHSTVRYIYSTNWTN